MELKSVKLEDLSGIRSAVFLTTGPVTGRTIVVVRFTGRYGIGSAGHDDAAYMRAIVTAAFEGWDPSGLVLDLTQLRYEWGDDITSVLCGGNRHIAVPALPTAVVVSRLCVKGLMSLVEQDIGSDPTRWFCYDMEAAVVEVESLIQSPDWQRVYLPDPRQDMERKPIWRSFCT